MKTENTTKLQEAFSLFVCPTELRQVMQKTFEKDGYVYATDASTLIRIAKKDCDFILENEHKPLDLEKLFPEENINVVLNIDKSIFEPYMTEDEVKYVGEDIDCFTCDGKGSVEWIFEYWEKEFDCPKCDGNGLSEEKQKVKTGNKTFGRFLVKLNDSYFSIENFYKLIKVRDLIGGEITLVHQSDNYKASIFRIGISEVILMPCYVTDINIDITYDGVLTINTERK